MYHAIPVHGYKERQKMKGHAGVLGHFLHDEG